MNFRLNINLKLLLYIWSLWEAKNIKLQFHLIWYSWVKPWKLGLNQSEATFGHLETSRSQIYQIQFQVLWYPWLKSRILGLNQPEATFGHLEPLESPNFHISVLCNLIPLAKIMILGLKINLKLLFLIWSLQEAININFQFHLIWYP